MRRRDLIALLGGTAAAWPLRGWAQHSAVPVIGYLSSKSEAAEAGIVAGMKKGLAEAGFTEGHNVSITYRWSAGDYDSLKGMAADLVARKVDVIAASGLPATLAAKAATSQIPIVFRLAVDPVAFALAESFDRPGGNLTGVTMMFDPLTPKKLELLHELVPELNFGFLVNPKNQNAASHRAHAQAAIGPLGLHLTVLEASDAEEIERAFELAGRQGVKGMLVGDDPLFDSKSDRLIDAAARHKIPTMYYVRDFTAAGGLISYGPSFDELAFHVGRYLGRILDGSKPAGLPVVQPTKFELVVNLKAAKALGLKMPPALLARADEVIE